MRSTASTRRTDGATVLRRGGALVVDTLCVSFVIGGIALALALLVNRSLFALWWALPVGYTVYYAFFEGVFAQTPGKRLFGLIVLGRDGSRCGLRAAFVRTATRAIDGAAFYLVGVATIMFTDGDRRLGDLLAGTQVVRTKR